MGEKIVAAAREVERARKKKLLEEESARNRAISRAWEAWLSSEEGQGCMTEGAYGEYLRNRLWRAFIAGALWTRLDMGEPSGGRSPQNDFPTNVKG